jgi:hypothetical protein
MKRKNKTRLAGIIFAAVIICLSPRIFADELAQHRDQSARRDPFVPLVGVDTTSAKRGIEGIFTIVDVRFQGIATGNEGEKAIVLNGEIIGEGETVGLVKVEEIGSNKAKISIDGVLHEISLYEHKANEGI